MEGALLFFGLPIVLGIIAYIAATIRDSNEAKLRTITAEQDKKKNQYDKLIAEYTQKNAQLEKSKAAFDQLVSEKMEAYPYLAAIRADFETIYYEDAAQYLVSKNHPAYTAAQNIRALRNDTNRILTEKHVIEYKLAYLLQLYPVLTDVLSANFDQNDLPRLKRSHIAEELEYSELHLQKVMDQNEALRGELATCRAAEQRAVRTIQQLRETIDRLKDEQRPSEIAPPQPNENHSYTDDRVLNIINNLNDAQKKIQILQEQIDRLVADIEEKDTIIANSALFSDDSMSLIPTDLRSDYIHSLRTERLDKATNDSFSFSLPLTISSTVISHENQYDTTLRSCTCPDHQHRHLVCKHMLALALRIHAFDSYENHILQSIKDFSHLSRQYDKKIEEYQNLKKALNDRYQTHPYLADMIARYKAAQIDARVQSPKSKRELMSLVKRLEKEKAMLQNQIAVYEYMFPLLGDFKELPPENLEQAIIDADGSGFHYQWLSEEDYAALTDIEKQQRWIEKYFHQRSGNAWEAGIKYERYIGYLCEKEGCKVKYSGALLKLNDMGRDLIATKGKTVYIIQCKRFAESKEIHENHLFQLFGSTTQYQANNPSKNVVGVFVTTTALSAVASQCAEQLGIKLYEHVAFQEYPTIKCNLSKSGEKIYHLPFDQQYDTVSIECSKGESYVATVAEAQALGYRHAMRHTFNG